MSKNTLNERKGDPICNAFQPFFFFKDTPFIQITFVTKLSVFGSKYSKIFTAISSALLNYIKEKKKPTHTNKPRILMILLP